MPKEQWDMMVKDALQKVEDVKQKYIAFLKEKNVSRVIRSRTHIPTTPCLIVVTTKVLVTATPQITPKFVHEDGHGAGQHLVHIAKEEKVNIIVIGCRGLGTVRRTVLGSVSDYVLHHASVPVVVCKN